MTREFYDAVSPESIARALAAREQERRIVEQVTGRKFVRDVLSVVEETQEPTSEAPAPEHREP